MQTKDRGELQIQMERMYFFSVSVALLASLVILWGVRFPPMQDYPAHLMIAKVVATAGDSNFNWDENYVVDVKYGPYSLSYNLIAQLTKFISIEYAGKVVISLYFILATLFVLDLSKLHLENNHVPWPLLLIFPLLYNQVYYLGFLNYLISIPILLWLIYDYQRLGELTRDEWRRFIHVLGSILLFLLHPFSLMLYCGLAIAVLINRVKGKKENHPWHAVPLIWLVVITIWFVQANIGSNRSETVFSDLFYYWPVIQNIHFLLLPIIGNHTVPTSGVALVAWGCLAYIVLNAEYKNNIVRFGGGICMLLFLGYLLLPFNFLGYSYFSQRLGPLVLLTLVLYLSHKVIPSKHLLLLSVSVVALYYDIYQTHSGISGEIENILPIVEKVPANSNVAVMYINGESGYIDQKLYSQAHMHTHNYYHILVGGGYSPRLFYNDMLPVRYKEKYRSVQNNGLIVSDGKNKLSLYDYAMVRSHISLDSFVPRHWENVTNIEEWHLFRLK